MGVGSINIDNISLYIRLSQAIYYNIIICMLCMVMMVMHEFQLVRFIRELQRFKQAEVAEFAKIKQPSLNAFELGKASLSLATRQKVATFLNINPLYISGEAANPFKSDHLIKMRLPETLLGGIDYSIIYFLAEYNKVLNVIFFITASPLYSKFLGDTVFGYPVYAIGVQDSDNNMFLIRRRKLENILVGEREVIVKLADINKQGICKATTYHQVIYAGQEKKFKDFSITISEIADYFSAVVESPIINTKLEDDLIKFIRENNIAPQDIIDYLKSIK